MAPKAPWLAVGALAILTSTCARHHDREQRVPAPAASISEPNTALPEEGPSPQLLGQVSAGVAQGPVPRASVQEASVMIIIDGDWCLATLAADVLQRAGYSVWNYWNPCLEGTYLHLGAELHRDSRKVSLQGGILFDHDDVVVTRTAATLRAIDEPIARADVQALVASMLESPGFRKHVGNVSATQSADHFITSPFDSAQRRTACALLKKQLAAHR